MGHTVLPPSISADLAESESSLQVRTRLGHDLEELRQRGAPDMAPVFKSSSADSSRRRRSNLIHRVQRCGACSSRVRNQPRRARLQSEFLRSPTRRPQQPPITSKSLAKYAWRKGMTTKAPPSDAQIQTFTFERAG